MTRTTGLQPRLWKLPYKCDKCPKRYSSWDMLKRHLYQTHDERDAYYEVLGR